MLRHSSAFGAGLLATLAVTLLVSGTAPRESARPVPPQGGKLRIIAFGAHPDDAEIYAGGVAAKWAAQGHHVKFVSCTNGDIGHWGMAGGALAKRRTAEVKKCAEIFGIETEVLDIHDGELMVTMDNRRTICRKIREWNADVVISHRPNDYDPDLRYTGVLVMDAAYMVTVPFFCPDTPHLKKNPVFLFSRDRFRRPNPFTADIVVAIDDVIEKKFDAMEALESQFYEGGCNGGPRLVPDPGNASGVARRKKQVRGNFSRWFASSADAYRDRLKHYYGDAGAEFKYAEAFEICEYGRRPNEDEIRKLFPFFPAR